MNQTPNGSNLQVIFFNFTSRLLLIVPWNTPGIVILTRIFICQSWYHLSLRETGIRCEGKLRIYWKSRAHSQHGGYSLALELGEVLRTPHYRKNKHYKKSLAVRTNISFSYCDNSNKPWINKSRGISKWQMILWAESPSCNFCMQVEILFALSVKVTNSFVPWVMQTPGFVWMIRSLN